MRTRNQSKSDKDGDSGAHPNSAPKSHDEQGSLLRISKEAVGKLLVRANSRRGRKQCRPSDATNEKSPRENRKQNKEYMLDFCLKSCIGGNAEKSASNRGEGVDGSVNCDANEMDWEDGTISVPEFSEGYSHDHGREVTVEFTESPSSAQRKRSRRASAEDKELAELVHKVHLLCLLARGRLVDNACNDPLLQASILSLLPSYLLKIMEIPIIKANMLGSLVRWFHENFRVHSQSVDRGSFNSNLAYALEAREGTVEEVAALSVALFRALNLRTRYVSVLDVAPLKPDADVAGTSTNDEPRLDTRLHASTTIVASSSSPADASDIAKEENAHRPQKGKLHKNGTNSTCRKNLLEDITITKQTDDGATHSVEGKSCSDNLDSCSTKCACASKRKSDLEFELQMEMALSATAAGNHDSEPGSELHELKSSTSSPAPPRKKLKKPDPTVSVNSGSSAVWSRKNGPPFYWAEVYCSLETLTGRWVHIDAANGVVDGEQKVEAAAAACRRPLKYVVAFAGNGAKDVTRRYCMQWYKIAPRRLNSDWWDAVLSPLRELESNATGGMVHENAFSDLDKKSSEVLHPQSSNLVKASASHEYPDNDNLTGGPNTDVSQQDVMLSSEPPCQFPKFSTGISHEDMELETRALTEPLPTSQLAYKSHHLYAIERWLTKHQILHPKGSVLGYCSGHPVYPRSCVQTLQTKNRWLRVGLQVKANETPAKVVKRSKNSGNVQISEANVFEEENRETNIELYGKWQLETLKLPHAVHGIVPKNEWGRVDAWSEKCLPPGTIHLRLPRLVPVAKRLGIDFAPAMVGFEFRNGRSFPVYEGIVVCTEFKGAIMEAYEEEEERREAEERKRNEAQALSRWFQLLSSIVTRQRLQNSYVESPSVHIPLEIPRSPKNNKHDQSTSLECKKQSRGTPGKNVQEAKLGSPSDADHVHVFPSEDQSFDEESMVRTKRCPCGFSIQVEEL